MPENSASLVAGRKSRLAMRPKFAIVLGWLLLAAAFGGYGSRAALAEDAVADSAASSQGERLPPGARVARLEIVPAAVELTQTYDYSQLLITAHLADGEVVDATRLAAISAPSELVRISPRGQVTPVADGTGRLTATLGDVSSAVDVRVTGQQSPPPVSFTTDVMPILTRLGCNAGACHGADKGKNGFKLSLRGYDPQFDHRSLIDDLAGRRFNRAAPENSLMLLKPSGGAPHVGGVLMQPGDRYHRQLIDWIEQGAPLDLDHPQVTGIEIAPQNVKLQGPGARQQMRVVAAYSDGSRRDVTAEAFIESSLAEVVEVDKQGLAVTQRRGEAALMARYAGAYAATRVVVLDPQPGFAWQAPPEHNFIDSLVYAKLREVKILPSELCTDEEFIRRVTLDLTGLPPEPADVVAFTADSRPTREKREALIDRLLGSADYIEHWTNKWADLLQVNRKRLGVSGAFAARHWIREAVAGNRPYDVFVREVLTASGSSLDDPAVAFYKSLRTPEDRMETATQVFLGIRFNCNKCHDHPFERWTQDQYYELAAYFSQVGMKEDARFAGQRLEGSAVEGASPAVELIYDSGRGEVAHGKTGLPTPPRFPFSHEAHEGSPADGRLSAPAPPSEKGAATRREQLADWLASPANPYFARSAANRIWSYLLGPGLIEPVDDIRAGNPPTNPELLDRLTEEFIASGFDIQALMRQICQSRTYQHSVRTNPSNADDRINYSHAYERRLPAETLYDAIHRVTGAVSRLPGLPPGARAVELPDSAVQLPDGFFNLFGKPARESSCECERSHGVLLGPVLNLVNGPTLANAIAAPGNRIGQLVASEPDDDRLIEQLFLAVLSRRPTGEEIAIGREALQGYALEARELQDELARYQREEIPRRLQAWIDERQASRGWEVLQPGELTSAKGATLTLQPDGSILASGDNPASDVYTLTASAPRGVTGFRLEVLPDASLPAQGPGRSPNGNFVLNAFQVAVAGPTPQPLELERPQATFSQDDFPIDLCVKPSAGLRGWAISPQFGRPQTAIFQVKATDDGVEQRETGNAAGDTGEGPTRYTITLAMNFGGKHTLGRFRLAATTSPRPVQLTPESLPADVTAALSVAAAQRTPQQQAALHDYFAQRDAGLLARQRALGELQTQAGTARLRGAQDLVWALVNSPAFLFNR